MRKKRREHKQSGKPSSEGKARKMARQALWGSTLPDPSELEPPSTGLDVGEQVSTAEPRRRGKDSWVQGQYEMVTQKHGITFVQPPLILY